MAAHTIVTSSAVASTSAATISRPENNCEPFTAPPAAWNVFQFRCAAINVPMMAPTTCAAVYASSRTTVIFFVNAVRRVRRGRESDASRGVGLPAGAATTHQGRSLWRDSERALSLSVLKERRNGITHQVSARDGRQRVDKNGNHRAKRCSDEQLRSRARRADDVDKRQVVGHQRRVSCLGRLDGAAREVAAKDDARHLMNECNPRVGRSLKRRTTMKRKMSMPRNSAATARQNFTVVSSAVLRSTPISRPSPLT